MHREGHIGLGLLVFSPVGYALTVLDATILLGLGLVATVFFSYAPDFDLDIAFLDHRGLTHTYLAAAVAGLISAMAILWLSTRLSTMTPLVAGDPLLNLVAIAALSFGFGALGVLSHIAGDMLTPMGVNPRRPFGGETTSLQLVYASNEVANTALFFTGALALIVALYAGIS